MSVVGEESVGASDATATNGEVLVELRNLKTYYGGGGLFGGKPVKAVDGVDLDIRRGETLGLVGESGCGKTTLGRTLIQLEEATDGQVLYDGVDITDLAGKELKQWRRNAQMVFQDPDSSLNDRMTVGEIVREPLDVHDWGTPKEKRARVRELLDTVGLQPEHYYRYPHQFSGGQKQRVGIARALALEPDFLVLDEPVSALDASVQAKILNLLEDLQDEMGLTYLFIAHDLSVVRHICDRVAVMYLGHVMEFGPTAEIFADPANPYTHSLLSAIPEPDPTAEKERITLRGTPPSPRDPPTGCPFSTRCPMKIRPPAYRDLDNEIWVAVDVFRDVLRERAKIERSPTQWVRQTLGLDDPYADIDEIIDEVFGRVEVPPAVQEHVDRAVQHIRAGDEAEARAYLREEFASVCEAEQPPDYVVSESGRFSHCHRHDGEHQPPGEFADEHFH